MFETKELNNINNFVCYICIRNPYCKMRNALSVYLAVPSLDLLYHLIVEIPILRVDPIN